ncbi:MAG: mevalonate kinase [Anaerolineaceae bacterium]|nr:mevalonate kinase [Anaerolineaceae bacterium]
MPAISASAPAKAILLGEHAVVYGAPAIAVPIHQRRTVCYIQAQPQLPPQTISVEASELGFKGVLSDLTPDDPIRFTIDLVQSALNLPRLPSMAIQIHSNIPIASGMGSGAAAAVALIRGLSEFVGHPLTSREVSDMAYSVEKLHHGNPSGIDNTVIAYEQAVHYVRGKSMTPFQIPAPFTLVIADSGLKTPTAQTVASVRAAYEQDPARHQAIFNEISSLTEAAFDNIQTGKPEQLGPLLTRNHQLLQRLNVSSPRLDQMVNTCLEAGALGAKLSGGGRGGIIIALVLPDQIELILNALKKIHIHNAFCTEVK